jgi:hypothetical protein
MGAPVAVAAPVLAEHEGIVVLRDDLLEGGSKVRVAPRLLASNEEWVFAGPAQGYAQLALAIACEQEGKRAVFFTAARKVPHPLTAQAMRHGLKVVWVPHGRMSNVQAKARAYCAMTGATHIPLGLLLPGMEDALAGLARSLPADPREVWVTAGSGTLARACGRAWPDAELHAVQVGMAPRLPARCVHHIAPEPFEAPAQLPPPFPSARAYDAKAWRFAATLGRRDGHALFWNVGAWGYTVGQGEVI